MNCLLHAFGNGTCIFGWGGLGKTDGSVCSIDRTIPQLGSCVFQVQVPFGFLLDQSVVHSEREKVSEHGYDDNDGVNCGLLCLSLGDTSKTACMQTDNCSPFQSPSPLLLSISLSMSMSGVADRSTPAGCAIGISGLT